MMKGGRMMKSIRSEILENIPMSILLVPFIAMRYAGDYHVAALVFGVAFFVVYAAVIYGYAGGNTGRFKLQSYGSDIATSGYRLVDMCMDTGGTGRIFRAIYIIRFMMRAGFMVYVVTLLLSRQNTLSFWVGAVSFVLICMYGASGSFGKRRVLGNVLIWWMLAPLILLAVLSISRMDYGNIAGEFESFIFEGSDVIGSSDSRNVFGTAWMIVAVMSTFELVLFSFARTRKNERRQGVDIIRVAVWLIVSVLLAYVYVLGMLGNRYVESGTRISLGNKVDYVLALSWMIGAFFVISSYIFYARELMFSLMPEEIYVNEICSYGTYNSDKWCSNEQKILRGDAAYFKLLLYGLIFTGTLFFVCCFHYEAVRTHMIKWLVYGDVALSLILPGVLIIISGRGQA